MARKSGKVFGFSIDELFKRLDLLVSFLFLWHLALVGNVGSDERTAQPTLNCTAHFIVISPTPGVISGINILERSRHRMRQMCGFNGQNNRKTQVNNVVLSTLGAFYLC